MTQPVLEKIIERLQSCIVDARSVQLKMLEQLLSMAVLQAREDDKIWKKTARAGISMTPDTNHPGKRRNDSRGDVEV
jgi:hypothetical protein